MPKYFHFIAPEQKFTGQLQSSQCTANTKKGARCKRNVVIGGPYCRVHLLYKDEIKVLDSTIPQAEKGLFAYNVDSKKGDVIFEKGEHIVDYGGETIDNETLTNRYGEYTAPYGLQTFKGKYRDGALKRSSGTLVNHQPSAKANAKFSVSTKTNVPKIVATKPIKQSQEIFVNYGRQYKLKEPGVRFRTSLSKL